MEDRFKFRFWCEKDKTMYYVNSNNCIFTKQRRLNLSSVFNNESDRYIPLQCTGLKDRNGKLIYEGDLLRYPAKDKYEQENYACLEVFFHDNDCCDNHIGFQLGRVHFHGCLCGMSFGNKYKFIPKNANEMEVIGNIYENKELLEEDKNENKSKRLNFVKGCAE